MVMAGALCGAPAIISSFARGPLTTETVFKAQTITLSTNHTCMRTQEDPPRICSIYFNGVSCVKTDKNRHPVRMSVARMKQYKNSLEGTVRADTKTDDIPMKHMSIHEVQVLNHSPLDLNFDEGKWTYDQLISIRSKLRCDCKAFFSSGWHCSHVLAALHFLVGLDLKGLMSEIAPRKLPGRPRKISRALTRGEGVYSQNYIMNLLQQFPARALNWKVLHEREVSKDGRPAREFLKGTIANYYFQRGVYYWNAELSDNTVVAMSIHEVAAAVELAHSSGIDVCGD